MTNDTISILFYTKNGVETVTLKKIISTSVNKKGETITITDFLPISQKIPEKSPHKLFRPHPKKSKKD